MRTHSLFATIGRGLVAVTILLSSFATVVHAAFEVPPNDGFLTDQASLLSDADKSQIESILQAYRNQTTNEIAVVILPNLSGYTIEEAALEIGRKWGVGSTKNNGILMLVAYEEREVRIEVGYGLEGAVPDLVAKGIIDTDIVPFFREGQYASGIKAAIDSLQKHIGNEYTAERYATEPQENPLAGTGLIIGFVLFQWLLVIMSRTKSWWLGGVFGGIGGIILVVLFSWWISIPFLVLFGLFLDFVVSRNYKKRGPTSWWAGGGWGPGGGGGFGGGGGGFGGFGGGSFGGGGASGRW